MHLYSTVVAALLSNSLFESVVTTAPRLFFGEKETQKLHSIEGQIQGYGDNYEKLNRRPIVMWHGLGDNFNSSGMHKVSAIFDQIYPDIYIHSIFIDSNPSTDEHKSLFGDANDQVKIACEQLSEDKRLSNGFDAIGFSQGGVLLRGLVERCSSISVNNLITFGSPHMGVLELPLCRNDKDWVCKRRNQLLKRQVWNDNIQRTVLPASYFRDPYQYDKYTLHSHYLADVNNELVDKDDTSYRENLIKLNNFVLITFTQDTTLVPKDSAGFQDVDINTGKTIPFDETTIYKEDLIGIKYLHEANKLKFLTIDGDHMAINETFFADIATEFLGGLV